MDEIHSKVILTMETYIMTIVNYYILKMQKLLVFGISMEQCFSLLDGIFKRDN